MKPKDVFGVVVRVLGVIGVLWGGSYLISTVYLWMGGETPPPGYTVYHYLFAGLEMSVVGIYFLRGAPHLIRFAYPEQKEEHKDSDKPAAS